MFTTIIWVGTAFGVLAGIAHGIDIYRQQMARRESDGLAMVLYRGLWALVLWSLFGFYFVALWIIGLVLRPVLGVIFRRRRVA